MIKMTGFYWHGYVVLYSKIKGGKVEAEDLWRLQFLPFNPPAPKQRSLGPISSLLWVAWELRIELGAPRDFSLLV